MTGSPPEGGGLSSQEAARRLREGGANAIAGVSTHLMADAFGKLWAPVPWMLEAAILLQLLLGDYVEAAVVAVLLIFNAALGFIQESRARSTIDALRSRLALVASVRRDGNWISVPAGTVVPGDLVKLSLGSIVAADVRLIAGSVLLDQSMLTGESLPIEAGAGAETYAGALVRRGEATGDVTATGTHTKFGRTAELVQSATVESSQQKAILRVVRNLALFNGGVTILLTAYAVWLPMPRAAIIPLILVAILSSIPVALPSMFTLAAAVGARALARHGVLPTRLSAVDEAGGIDILCCDKTGTLTRNELSVMSVHAMPGFDEAHVLAMAALASSDGGQDPVDAAIRAAAAGQPVSDAPALIDFVPFDPSVKRAEATVRLADGTEARVVKGAFTSIESQAPPPGDAAAILDGLQAKGFRVLAVAAGPMGSGPVGTMKLVGLVALSDPPRADSAALISKLASLGVRTIMVTGDAQTTAVVVAESVGIRGKVWAATPLPDGIKADDYAVFAGVLPEDKYRLVKALQNSGHIVGMCGDGANDAPALRQAQMGIAVLTASDVAKSSAGIVLTGPGLGGVVAAVNEGRATFQRILTYTLRTIVHKTVQVLFLAIGLVMTGQAILTPLLMVLMMITGDFLAMSSSTDNVHPSEKPSVWRIGSLTAAGIAMGAADLLFCVSCLSVAHFVLRLGTASLQTFTAATLVFSSQAVFYVSRERRHLWSSRPGKWLLITSVVDLSIVSFAAINGILMTPVPSFILGGLLAAAILFAFILDEVKLFVFGRLKIG